VFSISAGKKMETSFLVVNDHHSLIMNEDDLARSEMIPKEKVRSQPRSYT
jgi:hypothetical protein